MLTIYINLYKRTLNLSSVKIPIYSVVNTTETNWELIKIAFCSSGYCTNKCPAEYYC